MPHSNELAAVEALERRLLETKTRCSKPQLETLIADDFLEYGRSGRLWNKAGIVDALLQSPELSIEVDCNQSRRIGSDVVLLTYTSRRQDQGSGAGTLRSSIWHRNNGFWQIVYHQASIYDQ